MSTTQRGSKYRYELKVEQQPVRARMCGFGDKDRRPITPPPCVRLIVKDATSGQEVEFNEVDSTFFVLTVDLWNAEMTSEVNLVRHNTGTPTVSISTSSTTSYPPTPERPQVFIQGGPIQLGHQIPQPYGHPMHQQPHPQYHAHPGQQQQMAQYYTQPVPGPMVPGGYYPHPTHQGYPSHAVQVSHSQPAGMFTRNLIGSLSVNAFKLNDTEGKTGFWFVLQDLSVRTEGIFRLKMNFVDVGSPDNPHTLNTSKAPVLATCFSEPFQVYSAKKFPGVIESTLLSKAFASQGIKIPIRKDGPKVANAGEYEED